MQIFFCKDQIEVLSSSNGLLISPKINPKNQKVIKSLLEQAQTNAQNYLDRKKLGQKLDILEENNLFNTLVDLKNKLNLAKIPRRIECYDISHLGGQFVYGSMVVFIDAIAKNSLYRIFKCPSKNDDFGNHKLVLRRRIAKYFELLETRKTLQKELVDLQNEEIVGEFDKTQEKTKEVNQKNKQIEKNKIDLQGWKLPDLIIVDGGKGQLSADFEVLCEFGLQNTIEIVSLAKKEEEIFTINHLGFTKVISNFATNDNTNHSGNETNYDVNYELKTETNLEQINNTKYNTNFNNSKVENQAQNQIQNQTNIEEYDEKEIENLGKNQIENLRIGQNKLDNFSKKEAENDQNKLEENLAKTTEKNTNLDFKIGSQGGILLENSSKYLVQRIRDEAHRFAIKHNRNARIKSIKNSSIDAIIGPKTKIKLLQKFGSFANLSANLEESLELVIETVGVKTTQKLQKFFEN